MKTPGGEDSKALYLDEHLDKFSLVGRRGFSRDPHEQLRLVDCSLHGHGIFHPKQHSLVVGPSNYLTLDGTEYIPAMPKTEWLPPSDY